MELHESLLNTLPSAILQSYLSGYAHLMHRGRFSSLLRQLNLEIVSQHTFKRFDYSKFLEQAAISPHGGPFSTHSRTAQGVSLRFCKVFFENSFYQFQLALFHEQWTLHLL